jgi:Aldehyde dehydrogenase family
MAKTKTPAPKAAAAKSNGKAATKAAAPAAKPEKAAKAAPAPKTPKVVAKSAAKSAPVAKAAPVSSKPAAAPKAKAAPTTKPPVAVAENGSSAPAKGVRLNVQKTYKLYIGGAFPRTESGRFIGFKGTDGQLLANYCRGSRKDFRNAVVAARKAFEGWAHRAHFNRGQILYRIAEMLEGRRAQFIAELIDQGQSAANAEREVTAAIDRMVYYAGWCDKYQQVFSSVNAVSSSHFDFSMLEPTGVVGVFAPQSTGLLGLVSVVAPLIAGGNVVIVLASEKFPLSAITFAEVIHSSDVPGGVVNVLTGYQSELKDHFSTHMDVNAVVYAGNDKDMITALQKNATHNVKRILLNKTEDWYADAAQSPYLISEAQEVKTTWHPVGV